MPPVTETKLVRVKLVPPSDAATRNGIEVAGVGSEIVTSFRLFRFFPVHAKWTARITEFEWDHHFADQQIKGPFKRFYHRHELKSEIRNGIEGTVVRDAIEYEVGFGFLGKLLDKIYCQSIATNIQIPTAGVEENIGYIDSNYLIGSTNTAVP